MSVYKTPRSRYYQYDFVQKGRRFQGSTGQETRRHAEAVERKLRLDAAEGRLGEAAQLSLDTAAGKWWAEHGSGRQDRDDVERRVARVLQLVGKDRRLVDITTAVVSEAVQRRRGQGYTKSPAPNARVYLPSNATVNRDVIDTLRPIMERARTHWGAVGLPVIDWKALRLAEPRETVRIYSDAEQAAWAAECGAAARLALDLLLTYGLRFGELFFPLDSLDADGPRLHMQTGRKWQVPHVLPLREEHGREIAARVGRARAAGLEHIWFTEEEGRGDQATVLIPITYGGLEARLSSAADRADIKGGRRIHGARHHAGTAMLRNTNTLRLTQKLLGHAGSKSTMRYAHAVETDLRDALDAGKSRNSPGAPEPRPEKRRRSK